MGLAVAAGALGTTEAELNSAILLQRRHQHHDAIIIMMRTTVNLPDDLYEVVRSLAAAKRISLGEAMAELLRQGLRPRPNLDSQTAFPRFSVGPAAPPITLEQTLQAEDEP